MGCWPQRIEDPPVAVARRPLSKILIIRRVYILITMMGEDPT